jgi:hypothetical protein
VGNSSRKQKHVSFPERYADRFSVLLDLHGYITLQLIIQFFCFIVMIVFARIGSGDDHYNIVTSLRIKILISYRGL